MGLNLPANSNQAAGRLAGDRLARFGVSAMAFGGVGATIRLLVEGVRLIAGGDVLTGLPNLLLPAFAATGFLLWRQGRRLAGRDQGAAARAYRE